MRRRDFLSRGVVAATGIVLWEYLRPRKPLVIEPGTIVTAPKAQRILRETGELRGMRIISEAGDKILLPPCSLITGCAFALVGRNRDDQFLLEPEVEELPRDDWPQVTYNQFISFPVYDFTNAPNVMWSWVPSGFDPVAAPRRAALEWLKEASVSTHPKRIDFNPTRVTARLTYNE